ncbi:cellobiohydrolase I [Clavulina sp. PMI_390]|nr:cellobiohydrolase I [Clavulina sp. PMI_390]
MFQAAALLSLAIAGVRSQGIGTNTAEVHPTLSWQTCTSSGCTTNSGSIVLDANWRWVHNSAFTNCYTGNAWDTTICPDGTTCAENCQLDGANYSGTYGITTSGSTLQLNFLTTSSQLNVGSRVYLLDSTNAYHLFKPLNREFTFDVNVANLPCGLNGAVYFSTMDADGGMSKYPNNKAGAQYGTGYCDSQCPRDLKFINGVGNVVNWTSTDSNSGVGSLGSCCGEMDIWEANSVSAAYTPHPCGSAVGQTECTGTECGATSTSRYGGYCDPDGCDFNSYRMGNTSFYGPSKTIDTSQTITVVTQWITADGTDTGTLSEIRRFYVQNGKVIPNSQSTISGVTGNSLTDSFCTAQKTAFGDTNSFSSNGGMAQMSKSLAQGVVLVMSLWDDHTADMLWLDSDYPTTKAATTPGVARGTCATSSGDPTTVEAQDTSAKVTYANIKFGTIGSTYSAGTLHSTMPVHPEPRTTTSKASSTSSGSGSSGTTVPEYGQCGGIGYTGSTTCASGYTCTYSNAYYSQCL